LRAAQATLAAGLGGQYAICVEEQLAGVIGQHHIDWPNRAGMLGYWLGAAYEGRGLMTHACRALVTHMLREQGLHRVEVRAAPGNRRSRAIPERLGFRQEGILRDAEWLYDHYVDLVVYAMLADDWPE
jgi:ribosomal-protein-serine acetyltransferase